MKIEFWEKAFEDDNTFLFGAAPNRTILELEHLLDKQWNILDVGCGDGKNSIYLAKQGFEHIDAFDVSENAINKIGRLCEKHSLNINTQNTTVQDFKFDKQYDLMLSFGVFHFVAKDEWKTFIERAKENTKVGGIHIIQMFTDDIAPTFDIAPYAIGMAKNGEIKSMYEDWDILQFLSYTFEEEHENVPRHKHSSNKLVARKVK